MQNRFAGPRLLVVHETLDGALREQGAGDRPMNFGPLWLSIVRMTGTHVVAVSKLKGRSWGFEEDIVPFSADPMPIWFGTAISRADCALRITSTPAADSFVGISSSELSRLACHVGGQKSGSRGRPAFRELGRLEGNFSAATAFTFTPPIPQLEDGYNMATLEAMAAGLPVIGQPPSDFARETRR